MVACLQQVMSRGGGAMGDVPVPSPDEMLHAFVACLQARDRLTPQAATWINQALQRTASRISVPIPVASAATQHPFFEVGVARYTEQACSLRVCCLCRAE